MMMLLKIAMLLQLYASENCYLAPAAKVLKNYAGNSKLQACELNINVNSYEAETGSVEHFLIYANYAQRTDGKPWGINFSISSTCQGQPELYEYRLEREVAENGKMYLEYMNLLLQNKNIYSLEIGKYNLSERKFEQIINCDLSNYGDANE